MKRERDPPDRRLLLDEARWKYEYDAATWSTSLTSGPREQTQAGQVARRCGDSRCVGSAVQPAECVRLVNSGLLICDEIWKRSFFWVQI